MPVVLFDMYDTILVPTDGSELAESAIDGALALAERHDAAVHVIHVIDLGELPDDATSEAAAELSRGADQHMKSVVDAGDQLGVTPTTTVVESDRAVHREIVEYADDHDADLIVMGTHGRKGIDQRVLGSTTERTLRVSSVPVLTVHDGAVLGPDFETILVPTDGSDVANAAANHAISLADGTDAAVHVVHAVDTAVTSTLDESAAVLAGLEDDGRAAVDAVIERADGAELRSVQASVLSGTPARSILDYTDEYDVDLVVMGTHGRTGLERYLLGSVTEKVVRLADVPVLSVPGRLESDE